MKKNIIVMLSLFMAALSVPALATGPYVDNGDGTVSDLGTGLMWQQSDDGVYRTWKEALAYCENATLAGYSDWRLPNIRELETIVDDTCYNPSIDTNYFMSVKSYYYWSGSTVAVSPNYAWYVYFYDGYVNNYYKTYNYNFYVRCVRSGPSGPFDPLVISVQATPLSGTPPLTTYLSARVHSGEPPYTFSWDFGDETTGSSEQSPSHTYTAPGTYTATCTVTDSADQIKSDAVTITVEAESNNFILPAIFELLL